MGWLLRAPGGSSTWRMSAVWSDCSESSVPYAVKLAFPGLVLPLTSKDWRYKESTRAVEVYVHYQCIEDPVLLLWVTIRYEW